jgi:hypothetical protein
MEPVELGNTRISTYYAQNSPRWEIPLTYSLDMHPNISIGDPKII